MMKSLLLSSVLIAHFFHLIAQDLHEPKDYLDKDFFKDRREALRKLMPDNSVAVIFAYPERVFSKDVNYVYHPNPDLYYLSGYKETDAVLIIFKETQHQGDSIYDELFFVRKRNPSKEQWTGRRLGVEGVRTKLGIAHAYNGETFDSLAPDFSKFKIVLHPYLREDFLNDWTPGCLHNLIETFTIKTKTPVDRMVDADLETLGSATSKNLEKYLEFLNLEFKMKTNEDYKNDSLIVELLQHPDSAGLETIKNKIKSRPKTGTSVYNHVMATLREIKTPRELELIRKSVEISSIAHAEAMKAIRPNISERELEGILTYVHKKYGAEDEAYPPIVGAGANGCILHYEENNSTDVENQLVLMDVASEYHGYAADVTRTVPSGGKFTPDQKAIYQLVYDAQEEIFKLCKEGTPFNQLNEKAIEVLADGLLRLRIIKNKEEISTYYPHTCSHHLGLDVHDLSNRGDLKAGMVITVEPGIYIPAGSKCDKKWWNIGVRIEDDVVIGKEHCTVLSYLAPRKVEDIEKMIGMKSPFRDFVLPALK